MRTPLVKTSFESNSQSRLSPHIQDEIMHALA